jgi:hypothetical protein
MTILEDSRNRVVIINYYKLHAPLEPGYIST